MIGRFQPCPSPKGERHPLLDGLEIGGRLGAVNCAVARNGKLIGKYRGKASCSNIVKSSIPPEKTVVMFGAGGAARAIAWNWRWRAQAHHDRKP